MPFVNKMASEDDVYEGVDAKIVDDVSWVSNSFLRARASVLQTCPAPRRLFFLAQVKKAVAILESANSKKKVCSFLQLFPPRLCP